MAKLLNSVEDYDTSVLSPKQMEFFKWFLAATLSELIVQVQYYNESWDNAVVYYKKGYDCSGEVVQFWVDGLKDGVLGIIFACHYRLIDIHPDFVTEWTGAREDSKYISYGEYGSSLETVTFDT